MLTHATCMPSLRNRLPPLSGMQATGLSPVTCVMHAGTLPPRRLLLLLHVAVSLPIKWAVESPHRLPHRDEADACTAARHFVG